MVGVSSKACVFGGLELIIVDLLEAQSMHNISPPHTIYGWNNHNWKDIDAQFECFFVHLTNNGFLFLSFPKY